MAADLQKIDMKELEGGAHERWMELSMPLKAAIKKAQEPETITVLREHFYRISQRLQAAVDYFGAPTGEAIYLMHCPMAFDDAGADWLQKDETVLNPYFGSQMLHCGFVKETFTDEDNRESNENEQ
jgi:Cu(I)/Ag(I) efflux system membrane fusion protein